MNCLSMALLPFFGYCFGGLLSRFGCAGDYFAAEIFGRGVKVVGLYVAGIEGSDGTGDGTGIPQQCRAGLGGD